MDSMIVISLAGLAVAVSAAIASLWRISAKRNAEERLVELIEESIRHKTRLRRLLVEATNARAHADASEGETLALLLKSVEASLRSMSKRDQRRLEEALYQESQVGRSEYVKKLRQQILGHLNDSSTVGSGPA